MEELGVKEAQRQLIRILHRRITVVTRRGLICGAVVGEREARLLVWMERTGALEQAFEAMEQGGESISV